MRVVVGCVFQTRIGQKSGLDRYSIFSIDIKSKHGLKLTNSDLMHISLANHDSASLLPLPDAPCSLGSLSGELEPASQRPPGTSQLGLVLDGHWHSVEWTEGLSIPVTLVRCLGRLSCLLGPQLEEGNGMLFVRLIADEG